MTGVLCTVCGAQVYFFMLTYRSATWRASSDILNSNLIQITVEISILVLIIYNLIVCTVECSSAILYSNYSQELVI